MANRITPPPPPQYGPQPTAHERASAAWSPEDDSLLWDARENRKLGWPQTAELFQGKSPNACRKRYERLKLQKAPDEWEGEKFDALAEVYVRFREEMWKRIAEQLGDSQARWQILEQQVCHTFTSHFSSFLLFTPELCLTNNEFASLFPQPVLVRDSQRCIS